MKKIIAVVILALIAIAVCFMFENHKPGNTADEIRQTVVEQRDILQQIAKPISKPQVVCPIDFVSLQELNPDIYAWLEIPDVVSLPVVNRPGDDSYYHRKAIDGSYSLAGSLYTEDYNTRDFSDPVTVIYGHNMNTDEMFSTLESSYSSKEFFDTHPDFTIYMPNETKEYTIAAAVPYGNIHILDSYDFNNKMIFRLFFEDVMKVRKLNANFNDSIKIEPDDHIVILSTCLTGNDSNRYLVVAVENKQK